VSDFTLPVTVTCTPTSNPLTGSDCAVTTTLDAVAPGAADEGSRAVWQLEQVDVLDGGPDGDVSTPGNEVLATSGIFVP
jgi:hypothetical protein